MRDVLGFGVVKVVFGDEDGHAGLEVDVLREEGRVAVVMVVDMVVYVKWLYFVWVVVCMSEDGSCSWMKVARRECYARLLSN